MMNLMNHLGVIMDGNRRWAKSKGFESCKGHDKGADTFADICKWCIEREIGYLTAYAFSIENWQRTQIEVNHIFKLLERSIVTKLDHFIENGIRVRFIGERTRFSEKTLSSIEKVEAQTSRCEKLYVQIALSYGGRDEITRAARKIANDVIQNKLTIDDITEDVFGAYLDTSESPDIDLVIRTGGAQNRRLSNFLPWQTTYSELYFSDLLWPEFSKEEFNKALDYFISVPRKQGK